MNDPLEPLILELLDWIGPRPRPYAEVIEAWRTSCPKLPVWEEANLRGWIEQRHGAGRQAMVALTAAGQQRLQAARSAQPLRTLDANAGLGDTAACTSATILPSGSSTPSLPQRPCT